MLLVAGLARSIGRQRVWKNNDTFFDALMHDAPNGYRAHLLHGRHLAIKGRLREMEIEYRRAIRMFPYDAGMTLLIADAYTRVGFCAPAVALFEWTFGVEPEMGMGATSTSTAWRGWGAGPMYGARPSRACASFRHGMSGSCALPLCRRTRRSEDDALAGALPGRGERVSLSTSRTQTTLPQSARDAA